MEEALHAPYTHSATPTLGFEARSTSHQAIYDLDEQRLETYAISGLDPVGLDCRESRAHSRGEGNIQADGPLCTQTQVCRSPGNLVGGPHFPGAERQVCLHALTWGQQVMINVTSPLTPTPGFLSSQGTPMPWWLRVETGPVPAPLPTSCET